MNDVMILLHKMMVDLEGFNETHFGIFADSERAGLIREWKKKTDINGFLAILSPHQRDQVTDWMIARTKYDRKELSKALNEFVKYLKRKSKYKTYPFDKTNISNTKKN